MFSNSKCMCFSPISTDLLCLQHAQMSRTQDLVIFVPMAMMIMTTTTMKTDGQTGYFTPSGMCVDVDSMLITLSPDRPHGICCLCSHAGLGYS